MFLRPGLFALLAASAATAGAQVPVYKCVAEGGKVTYSQNPCYGENWHRLGEKRVERKPATAAPASPAVATSAAGATGDMKANRPAASARSPAGAANAPAASAAAATVATAATVSRP